MSNYIYHIELSNNKHYIGKYADTSIYQYHLKNAAPSFMGYEGVKSGADAWEAGWLDEININGVRKTFYVKNLIYDLDTEIEKQLRNSLGNYVGHSEIVNDIWNFIRRIWKNKNKTSYYEITEALAIMLAYNSLNLCNTQIDFMGRSIFNDNNKGFFDESELKRKLESEIKKRGHWFISYTIPADLDDNLKALFDKYQIKYTGKVGKTINILVDGRKDLTNALYKEIKNTVEGEVRKQIIDDLEYILQFYEKTDEQWQDIRQLIVSLQSQSNKGDQADTLKKIHDKIRHLEFKHQKLLKQIEKETNIKYKTVYDWINGWLNSYSFNNLKFQYDAKIVVTKHQKEEFYRKKFCEQYKKQVLDINNQKMKNFKRISTQKAKTIMSSPFTNRFAEKIFDEQYSIALGYKKPNSIKFY